MVSKAPLKDKVIDFTDDLIAAGATYASVILTKGPESLIYHSSDEEWDKIYHESGYSKNCHLIAASRKLLDKSKGVILFWDLINPTNETSIYLNEQRKHKNLCHGISLCQKNVDGTTQIITLTGRMCDINFANAVVKNKLKILEEFLKLKTLHKLNLRITN